MFLCHSVLPAPTLVGKKNVLFKKNKKKNNIAKKRNKHAAKQERY